MNASPRRGFVILELLIVVAIILFLTVYFYGGSGGSPGRPNAPGGSINRARQAACGENLSIMQRQIDMMENPKSATLDAMQKRGFVLKCLDGGQYTIEDGKIYCSVHSPPPKK